MTRTHTLTVGILVALAVLVVCVSVATAQTQTTTQAETTAVAGLWTRAVQGNAEAQYNLGQMYYKGQGVPQDYAQAAVWYRRAADRGAVFPTSGS